MSADQKARRDFLKKSVAVGAAGLPLGALAKSSFDPSGNIGVKIIEFVLPPRFTIMSTASVSLKPVKYRKLGS